MSLSFRGARGDRTCGANSDRGSRQHFRSLDTRGGMSLPTDNDIVESIVDRIKDIPQPFPWPTGPFTCAVNGESLMKYHRDVYILTQPLHLLMQVVTGEPDRYIDLVKQQVIDAILPPAPDVPEHSVATMATAMLSLALAALGWNTAAGVLLKRIRDGPNCGEPKFTGACIRQGIRKAPSTKPQN